MKPINWDTFNLIDFRVGTVVSAQPFKQGRKPAYILRVDFGPEVGILKSTAQITVLYDCNSLVGTQVIAVTNLQPKQSGPIQSQCLITGFQKNDHAVVLAQPDRKIPNGMRLS